MLLKALGSIHRFGYRQCEESPDEVEDAMYLSFLKNKHHALESRGTFCPRATLDEVEREQDLATHQEGEEGRTRGKQKRKINVALPINSTKLGRIWTNSTVLANDSMRPALF